MVIGLFNLYPEQAHSRHCVQNLFHVHVSEKLFPVICNINFMIVV